MHYYTKYTGISQPIDVETHPPTHLIMNNYYEFYYLLMEFIIIMLATSTRFTIQN